MKILINNQEVVCSSKLTITEEMLNTSSTILNNCYPKSWETTHNYTENYYYPEDYSKCLIYDDNNNLLFCGVAKRTGNINLNPRQFHGCDLQILDFKTFLSEGDTLDFVITNKTVLEAIEMVINAIKNYGVELGNINIIGADDVIGAYSTAEKTAYDVFNYLADITQSRWTTRLINEQKIAVDFYDPSLMPTGTTLEYNDTFFRENNIDDISYSYSTQDYRNKQVMLSEQVYGSTSYTENFISDGYNKTFLTESPVANIQYITVNGVEMTFLTTDEKELGLEADFYYTPGVNQIETSNYYPVSDVIYISYTPLVKGRQVVYNNDEVNRVSSITGRNGVVARYENRNDTLSIDELLAIGNSYIKYKGTAEIILTIKTHNNDLWNIGETVETTEMPLDKLNTNYMVKTKSTEMILTTGDIFYTYTLTSSYNSENAINYFDNQRAKSKGNISVGEFIDRNIDIENETIIIFDNLQISESTLDGDNTLNSTLNSPFIN